MRILGINLKDEQRIEMSLTGVFGIGRSRAHSILDNAKVEYTKDEILSYNVSGSEVVVKTTDGTITLKEMYKTRSAEGYADPQEDSSK